MIPTKSFPVFLLAVTVAVSASKPGPAPRFDSWKIIGPGGGGTMIIPTISPHDPNIVLEHCDMTGTYITVDGAQSWRMFNLRGGVNTFAYDPSNPRVIYAGNAALWRSENTGRSWSMVLPDPKKNTVEHQLGDHSSYVLTSSDEVYPTRQTITAIAVDPADSNTIYVTFGGRAGNKASILVSRDRGVRWIKAGESDSPVLSLVPQTDGLLAVTATGIFRYRQGKTQMETLSDFPNGRVFQASVARTNEELVIYATSTAGALYRFDVSSRRWTELRPQLGQTAGRFGAVAASANHGCTVYVGFRGLVLGQGRENTFNGIAKSADAGKTWSIVHKESTHPSGNLEASWIEERAEEGGRDIWFDAPYSLGVAPTNPNICYATDLFRTYRTFDGGKSWQQVNSVRVGDNRWTTRGLDVTTNYGVHFDPFDLKHIFISYTDIGAFQSYDGGLTWIGATAGVPMRWRNTTYWIEFDPQVRGLLWGAFSGVHDLPRPKMWRRTDPERFTGGVGVSVDGGKSWTPSNVGMPETAVTHLLLDPTSPVGKRTLYACGFGRGVFKSVDNGKTWSVKNVGIEEKKPFAWRITRARDGTLYLIVARSNEGRYGEPGGAGALYRSLDGAEHWVKMKLPVNCNGPVGLTLDPRNSRRMYLAAWGQERDDVDLGGGVFMSEDGGSTWRHIFKESQHVYDVTVDQKNPHVLYACGFDAAAFRSIDGGIHWSRIRGFNFKWGHRVILDPSDPSKIYITTFGGSVWHGLAAGDPKAIEDILTPIPIRDAE